MSSVAPVTRVRFEGGRKVVTHGIARRREEWEVLIRNHHDGYITWEEYDRNQKVIAGNANMKGAMVRRFGAQWWWAAGWTAPMRTLRTQAKGASQ